MNKQKGLALSQSKGFTIIELVVVIAIIAVLAAIVLVNVTQYISKGRDAAAQGNLATMITNGAVYYSTNSTYTNFSTLASGTLAKNGACTGDPSFVGPCQAIVGTSGGTGGSYALTIDCSTGAAGAACSAASITNWCAQITLLGTGTPTYCVDSNGNKKLSGTCTAVTGVCS